MDEEKAVKMGGICSLLLLALIVALGIITHNFWVGLMCFAGTVLLLIGWDKGTDFEYGLYFLLTLGGLALIGGATWLARFAGRWLWIPVWLWAGFLTGTAGWYIRERDEKWVGWIGLTLGILCALFAFAGPLWLSGPITPPSLPPISLHRLGWWIALAVAGFASLAVGWKQGQDFEAGGYLLFSLVGVALLGGATWLSGFAYPGLWLALWLVAAGLVGHGGKEARWFHTRVGNFGLALSALCVLFAVVGPFLIPRMVGTVPLPLRGEKSTSAATPLAAWADRFGAAVDGVLGLLLAVIASGWGALYIALIGLLGELSIKKWGAPLFLGSLLLAALTAGLVAPQALPRVLHWASASPSDLAVGVLVGAQQALGSAGWGAVLIGLGMGLLLLPAAREGLRANLAISADVGLMGMLDTSQVMRRLRREGISLWRVSVATLLTLSNLAVPFLVWGAIWRLAEQGAPLSFPLMGIEDIALPRWRPVWQIGYFLPGILGGLINLIVLWAFRRLGVTAVPGCQSPAPTVLGPPLLCLFVPSGVMLSLIGVGLAQSGALLLLAGLENRRRKERRREWPARRVRRPPTPPPFPRPLSPAPPEPSSPVEQGRPPVSTASSHLPEPSSLALTSHRLLRCVPPLLDIGVAGGGILYTLSDALEGKAASVARWKRDGFESSVLLRVEKPLGLAVLPEGAPLVVGGRGTVVIVSHPASPAQEELPQTRGHETRWGITCFALNPFGTILACGVPEEGAVNGLILDGFSEQTLLMGLIGNPTALAFSVDGRFLAIGCSSGEMRMLDMSTRRILWSQERAGLEEGIIAIAPMREGGWVAAYEDRHLLQWSAEGELEAQEALGYEVTSLAADPARGRIAVGGRHGRISVRSPGLRNTLFAERVHADRVVQLIFREEGDILISAARNGEVQEVRLG